MAEEEKKFDLNRFLKRTLPTMIMFVAFLSALLSLWKDLQDAKIERQVIREELQRVKVEVVVQMKGPEAIERLLADVLAKPGKLDVAPIYSERAPQIERDISNATESAIKSQQAANTNDALLKQAIDDSVRRYVQAQALPTQKKFSR